MTSSADPRLPPNPDTQRLPHVALDMESRRNKALKIERLLALGLRDTHIELLEVGTGSGGIAYYFSKRTEPRYVVSAVDVVDSRVVHGGFDFQTVEGVELPFDSARFDAVISNHVIEHVGEREQQQHHLQEIARVLKADGVGYIAVPNRWMVKEPHYHLHFLSWLPRSWRTSYLRFRGRGQFYDCEPLELRELERMLEAAQLNYENISIAAVREVMEIEHRDGVVFRLFKRVPERLLKFARPVIPTLIYRVSPKVL